MRTGLGAAWMSADDCRTPQELWMGQTRAWRQQGGDCPVVRWCWFCSCPGDCGGWSQAWWRCNREMGALAGFVPHLCMAHCLSGRHPGSTPKDGRTQSETWRTEWGRSSKPFVFIIEETSSNNQLTLEPYSLKTIQLSHYIGIIYYIVHYTTCPLTNYYTVKLQSTVYKWFRYAKTLYNLWPWFVALILELRWWNYLEEIRSFGQYKRKFTNEWWIYRNVSVFLWADKNMYFFK